MCGFLKVSACRLSRKVTTKIFAVLAFAVIIYALWKVNSLARQRSLCLPFEDAGVAAETAHKVNPVLTNHSSKYHRHLGRHSHDGLWYSQTDPFHLYAYSAFYDNRETLRSQPQLAIITVMDYGIAEQQHSIWFCHVHYAGQEDTTTVIVRAVFNPVGAGVVVDGGSMLLEVIVTCPLTTDLCTPVSVKLAWGSKPSQQTVFRIPVEVYHTSALPPLPRDLAICISVSYGNISPQQLVEWIEMQRILGVDLIVFYNHSLSEPAAHVISQYASSVDDQLRPSLTGATLQGSEAEPFIELRQSHAFTRGDTMLHMSPVINDCMYRHASRFRYFAIIDIDELIVPRQFLQIMELVNSLSAGASYRVGSFVFRNAYFFLDIPVSDLPQPPVADNRPLSTYLVHQRRVQLSKKGYSAKSVIDANACVAMHNHYCWVFAPDVLSHWQPVLDVEPLAGLLHHYKRCHLDVYHGRPGECQSLMASTVVDKTINRYSWTLTHRLARKFASFNFTNVL